MYTVPTCSVHSHHVFHWLCISSLHYQSPPSLPQFFNDLKGDVMVNYSKQNELILAARVALFFMLITSYPVLLHPTRDSINR